MISKTMDMAQPSNNFETITLVVNNSVDNKSKYYNTLNDINKKVFKCNVSVKIINNSGLYHYIDHAYLNRDIYDKLLNLDFIHEPLVPINKEFFKCDNLITIG